MPPRRATSLDGLPDRSDLLSRSGLEFMPDMIAGRLAGPPIGATLGFWPILAEDGRVIFEGTPGFDVTNPMRGVHSGRSTGVASGELRGIKDDQLYATGSTTCIIMRPETD